MFATPDSVHSVTENGLTVVHLCCQATEQETTHLRVLAQKGARFAERSKNEFCPLHLAAFTGDVEKEIHPKYF